MEPIYVTGHQNPDTDSICAALSYAALRNALGDRQYTAARLGNVSDETRAVLDFFGVDAPKLLTNVRTQVSDLSYDEPPTLGRNVTVNKAWETLKGATRSAVPVVEADGKLYGMLTTGDIASYVMNSVYEFGKFADGNFNVSELLEKPIEDICSKEDLQYFHLNDYVDDVKDIILKSRFRCYPVLDENDVVVGTIGRFHLIRYNHKKVVLVDHNEASQSVAGLSQADILEIIDHHRLADIQTTAPVYFRNEPLGSTCSIVATMFKEKGVVPDEKTAGLLCAAIISDTVMFKSPTCTPYDIEIAERMAKIAKVDINELGEIMFAGTTSLNKPIEELLYTDFKEFHIAGYKLGISQVTCLNSEALMTRKDEFIKAMKSKKESAKYDYILLMLTDVLKEGTHLLYIGDEDTISQAYDVKAKDNEVFLPKVMSRKKQIVPRLSELWG